MLSCVISPKIGALFVFMQKLVLACGGHLAPTKILFLLNGNFGLSPPNKLPVVDSIN